VAWAEGIIENYYAAIAIGSATEIINRPLQWYGPIGLLRIIIIGNYYSAVAIRLAIKIINRPLGWHGPRGLLRIIMLL
jgi:hypothetical protein